MGRQETEKSEEILQTDSNISLLKRQIILSSTGLEDHIVLKNMNVEAFFSGIKNE